MMKKVREAIAALQSLGMDDSSIVRTLMAPQANEAMAMATEIPAANRPTFAQAARRNGKAVKAMLAGKPGKRSRKFGVSPRLVGAYRAEMHKPEATFADVAAALKSGAWAFKAKARRANGKRKAKAMLPAMASAAMVPAIS